MYEKEVIVTTKYGQMPSFVACPEAPGQYPGIIFYMDAPGIREELRNMTRRIAKAGVAVEATGHDTLRDDTDFFSYRRNTLQGVRDYGRGLSAIALEE